MPRTLHIRALQFVSIYFFIGCVWIIFSDRLLLTLFPASADLTSVQSVKGMFYVTVTSVLLFGLILRSSSRR